MGGVTFEKALELKKIGQDVYQASHSPLWTWTNSKVVPGGTLMSLAAAAAYETVGPDFVIDTLHTFFVAGPDYRKLLQFKIQRLNDGGRFCTRLVTAEQGGKPVVHVSCSFVRASAMSGPSMTHSVKRKTTSTADSITLDDLEVGKNTQGPVFKFQRLRPVPTIGPGDQRDLTPDAWTYTSLAIISPSITSADPKTQALGIIALSDYHILDCPPTLHGIPFGTPEIYDYSRAPTESHFSLMTSLNHTIRFHLHDGFRADELCYVEATTPWTAKRRAEVQSNIFSTDGRLIASCVQGAYYVLKSDEERSKL